MNGQRKRKTKTVPGSFSSDSGVPQPEVANGVQKMQSKMGCDLPPIAKGKAELAIITRAAAVQTQRGFVTVRASGGEGGAKTVAELEEYHEEGLAARAEEIDAHYVAGGVIEDVNLPQPIIDTAQQWLRAHNLIFASNDPAFWVALEYVLDSLESFSIDAVEQALVICTTEAFEDAARRSTIYQELKACRALKKIRDMQLKIRTAQVVAVRTLSAPYALAVKQRREAEAVQAEQDAIETQERLKIEELRRLPDEIYYIVVVDSALSGSADKKFGTLAKAQKFARAESRSLFIEKHVVHGDQQAR